MALQPRVESIRINQEFCARVYSYANMTKIPI